MRAAVFALLLVPLLAASEPTTMRLTDTVLHRLDPRVFGHFMERASWGEPGYESARLPGTRRLDPRVVSILESWRIPVIRWPGGTDLTDIDWRDMIDNVPGRADGRPMFQSRHAGRAPLSNEFGLEEFFALCRHLGAEPLLPVPLEPALAGEVPVAELALRHAGLVAYCNAPLGARLPAGMPDWPAVRAANGHPAPHNVKRFQLGNEVWMYFDRALERAGKGAAGLDERYAWYRRTLDACVEAMRAVDPSIELIMEGNPAWKWPGFEERLLADAQLRARVPWCVYHDYRPWAIAEVQRDGATLDAAALSAEDIWRAWVAGGPGFDAHGQSVTRQGAAAGALGWRVAITEWNWNGWWKGLRPALDSDLAKGVGAASYLHAFMRRPDIGLACQSMLVGSSWGITGIRVDPSGQAPPRTLPTGMAVGLYAAHHGDRVVALERPEPDGYAQPLRLNGIHPAAKVAWLDAVCTADDQAWYLHLINRRFAAPERLELDLATLGALQPEAQHHVLEGTLDNSPIAPGDPSCARVREVALRIGGPRLVVEVPERSVSVLVLRRGAP